MLIVTHATLRNPAALAVKQLPRKFFGRVTPWPRRASLNHLARIAIEFQGVRYMLALLPLLIIGFVWTEAALPLAQAPLLMIVVIWFVEMRVLRVPAKKRAALMDPAAADRGLDLLRAQSRTALTQIAASRDLRGGLLHLVIEQSDLRGLPPLTYVSVQSEDGPQVLDLTAAERDILQQTLFQGDMTERLLHRINATQNVFLRDITLDARSVSAHARLAAALAR
ncbi:hypothetical protein [Loktanella sp. M215]|uniref:hypothetical protein n=1 Tax=Loktanella sp. M215 TaxID=2675431 RepID=UPI001F1EB1D9|nr:hypothetical protein [Loktanella sp. M215]MCF7698360.1 hypothetical protein [Loktanella sp. M215]